MSLIAQQIFLGKEDTLTHPQINEVFGLVHHVKIPVKLENMKVSAREVLWAKNN